MQRVIIFQYTLPMGRGDTQQLEEGSNIDKVLMYKASKKFKRESLNNF